MSTTLEREQARLDVEEAIRLAAADNRGAAAYLAMIAQLARGLDDLQDDDAGPVDVGLMAYLALVALPRNPFFLQHAAALVSLHDAAINAWQDANQLDPRGQTAASRYWSDWLNEIACVVAGLAGGYAHRRSVSPQIRMLLNPDWNLDAPELSTLNSQPGTHHGTLRT